VPASRERIRVTARSARDIEDRSANAQCATTIDDPFRRHATGLAATFGVPLFPMGSIIAMGHVSAQANATLVPLG